MRTLKLALAAVAAFAFNSANAAPVNGMGTPPTGTYQPFATGQQVGASATKVVFHGGGVAACDGCHVMHNAQYGVAKSTTGKGNSVQPWTNVTNAYLLQGSDQSSTCLICHGFDGASQVQFTVADTRTAFGTNAPANYTPGGDFGWTNLAFSASPADRHGHNVVAADFPAFAADGTLLTAPGGTYTVTATGIKAFGCASCHDPHGRYRYASDGAGGYIAQGPSTPNSTILPIASSGSYGAEPVQNVSAVGVYRILGGHGYAPASNPSYPFPNDPPRAVAPETYNQSEASTQTIVAYGTGMSEWCQNCHTNIHLDGYTTGVAGLRHPAGSTAFLHATQYDIYNSYVSSGNMSGGVGAGYSSLVPFELGAGKSLTDLYNASQAGNFTADATSAVMCLSCHRAHASAFDSMVRWDQSATFLADGADWTQGLNTDRSITQTTAGYYGRSGASYPYQRSFCNKCHGKD